MKTSLTFRSISMFLVLDILFSALIPVAYLKLLKIDDVTQALELIALFGALKLATWAFALARMLQPAERCFEAKPAARTAAMLQRADDALQTVALRFGTLYAVTWAAQYVAVTAILLRTSPEQVGLGPPAATAVALMMSAVMPGAMAFAVPLVDLLVSKAAGEVFTLATAQDIAIDRPRSTVRRRLATLTVAIGVAPTIWLVALGYSMHIEAAVQRAEAHAEVAAERLARRAKSAPAGDLARIADEASRDGITAFFVAPDGRVVAGAAADRAIVESPALRAWIGGARGEGGRFASARLGVTTSYARADDGSAACASAPLPKSASNAFLFSVAPFIIVVFVWAPICGFITSRSLVDPIERITIAVRKITEEGRLGEVGVVPIVQNDEVGLLAEQFNTMVDLLRALGDAANRIAAGDLGVKIEGHGDMPDAFRGMLDNLQTMVRQIRETSIQLAAAAAQIYAASQEQEAAATSQASGMEEISHTMDSLSAAAAHVNEAVQGVAANAERTQETTDAMVSRIGELSAHASRIGEILDVIRDIADRSDLLALNGSLEAARAGEAGRGFSLVAAEMRRLAERVTASVESVKALVADIRASGSSTVMATDESKKLASGTSDAARQIALVTQQQRSGTEQVSQSVRGMAEVLTQTLSATVQTRSSVADLKEQADRLSTLVRRFRVDGAGP